MAAEQDPTELLVSFLSKFTLLIERELLAIRGSVVTTVEAIMGGIEEISGTVERNKRDADEILEFTYLHPDPETETLLEDVQSLADELIENVYREVESQGGASHPSSPESVTTSKSEVLVQNRLNRFNVKLEESVTRLNGLDEKVSSSVLGIVGALSSEDLIAQRLEHTILSLKSLQTGLSFLLIDYEAHCQMEEIERVTKSILTYTFRQYTTEEEKERFRAIFGKSAA